MKIYILRHEDRTIDCSFFGPLTKKGLINAQTIVDKIEKLNITDVYASPFIRTLQTIYPFIKKSKLKIKLEYGLTEIKNEDIVPKKSHNVELPVYIAENFNYDPEYKTFIDTNNIRYMENDFSLETRVKKVLKQIINDNYKTDKNILLVTHQGICKNVLKIIKKFGIIKPNLADIDNYNIGVLSLIFDEGNWTFKKI